MINKRFFKTGKIKIAITLILIAGSVTVNWGQTLWPGDVNNNGVVNTVDVLYWAYARGNAGPPRSDRTTDWQEIPVGIQWGIIFPNEIDYAYADCDGNGTIDDNDLEIIKKNFLQQRANLTPDTFRIGLESESPALVLTPDKPVIPSDASSLEVFIGLGSAEQPVDSFFAIAFTIPYDKQVLSPQKNRTRYVLPNDLLWLGNPPEDVKEVMINDTEAGKLHIAIYRKKGPVPNAEGFGPLGSIVMEDVIFGSNTSLELDPGEIMLMTKNLEETKVFPVGTVVISSTFTSASEDLDKMENAVLLYPNPASGQVWLQARGEQNGIQAFELYNLLGRLVQRTEFDFPTNQLRFDLAPVPTGLYLVRIKTESGFYTTKLKIQSR